MTGKVFARWVSPRGYDAGQDLLDKVWSPYYGSMII